MNEKSFRTLSLPVEWVENLDQLGYLEMTPIQARALPAGLRGEDLLGQANTGTGKTAAFGLALLTRISPAGEKPGALVLCPTRELADQVAEEIRRLARPLANTNVVTICGGRSFTRQSEALGHGVDVVVGTPGRVLDHLEKETLDLSEVQTLVLDEADRMLEMGFVDDVAKIVSAAPQRGQTLLFSATLSEEVRKMSESFQREAVFIDAVSEGEEPAIDHFLYEVGEMESLDALERVLGKHRPESAVIFCNQRDTCDQVAERLKSRGYSAESLHGGMEQRERDNTLLQFSNGSIRLLVATNVAARGLDVEELDGVINYELPRETKTFVHRVGRTGRAGEEGVAISLIHGHDGRRLEELKPHLGGIVPRPAAELPLSDFMPPPAEMGTIVIKGGRKDKLRPGDIVGAFTGDFGFRGDQIGDIKILDRIAFVALKREIAAEAVKKINQGRIKSKSFGAYLMK